MTQVDEVGVVGKILTGSETQIAAVCFKIIDVFV